MIETSFFPDNYRHYLTDAFEGRLLRNPRYSLRAFARDLGLGNSTLIEVLKGKYGLSKNKIESVTKALQLAPNQKEHFIDLIARDHSRKQQDREAAGARVKVRMHHSYQAITLDGFRVISDWYHLTLLELLTLDEYKNSSAEVLADKLALPEITIFEALERLERLSLIEKTENGFRPTDDFSVIGDESPSQAIRKFHKQILEKALAALDTQSVQQRENSSTVFAIHEDDLPLAKQKLLQFRREFSNQLSTRADKNNVYCLSMQFFSLLQNKTENL